MSVGNLCEIKKPAQSSLPASNCAIQFSGATPKEELASHFRGCIECLDYEIRQHGIHGRASFRSVEEQSIAFDAIGAEGYRISDSHPTVAKYEQERPNPTGVVLSRARHHITVPIDGRNNFNHLFATVGHRWAE